MKVAVVDEDCATRRRLVQILRAAPNVDEVYEVSSLQQVNSILNDEVDIIVVDLGASNCSDESAGSAIVRAARECGIVPVVMSDRANLSEVRAAFCAGAHDFVAKAELDARAIQGLLATIGDSRPVDRPLLRLRTHKPNADGIIGTSVPIHRLRDQIGRVARSHRPVLVTGETGTGKELVVRAIHGRGAQPDAPLLDLNCGALPAELVESHLFGHERGAFTGADRQHQGYFLAVGAGTLFLDEIGEMPLELQAKLLRVIEAGSFRPVGANVSKQFVGRIVAATHVDLDASCAAGRFRTDLYYRLNVLELHVPPLRERREDIPALVAHFSGLQDRQLVFSASAMSQLKNAPWPGNVRQLRNLIDRLAVFARTELITPEVLAEVSAPTRRNREDTLPQLARAVLLSQPVVGTSVLQRVEGALIDEALRVADGNRSQAARLLGIHRKVIERRLDRGTGAALADCADLDSSERAQRLPRTRSL